MKRNIIKLITTTLVITLLISSLSMISYADTIPTDIASSDVQEIINQLNRSENGIPDSVTKADINKVIDKGGSKGVEALLNIYESAIPVPDPIMDEEQISGYSTSTQERFSYKYNIETSEVTRVDGSEFEYTTTQPITQNPLIDSSSLNIMPMAFPTDWYTPDPQNYSDTRKTCKLIIVAQDMSTTYGGTGFLTSNKTVVTAGHCLYDPDYGANNWCGYVIVIPSYSASNTTGPYGRAIDTTSIEVGGYWANNWDWTDDWGMLHLTDSFSIGYYTPLNAGDNIVGWWVRIQGYAGGSNDLFNTGGNVVSANGRAMRLTAESKGGMSGGPVSEDTNGYIIGINRGHYSNGNAAVVKIDSWLYNKIMSNR